MGPAQQTFMEAVTSEPPHVAVGGYEIFVGPDDSIQVRPGAQDQGPNDGDPFAVELARRLALAVEEPDRGANFLVRDAAGTLALPWQLQALLARSTARLGVLLATEHWPNLPVPSAAVNGDRSGPPYGPRLTGEALQREILRRRSLHAETMAQRAARRQLEALARRIMGADDPLSQAIAQGLARNGSCPAAILEQLVDRDEQHVDCLVAQCPHCPPALLARIAQRDGVAIRWVPLNPACPADLLALFVERPILRDAVAAHPAATAAMLERLAQTNCDWLCPQLARNPSSSPLVLEWVAEKCGMSPCPDPDVPLPPDADVATLGAVLRHPRAPAELVARLGGQWRDDHKSCENTTIHALIDAGVTPVDLLADPATSADVLQALPTHANRLPLVEVIVHPNCPETLVGETVAKFGQNDVRALLARPVLPGPVLRALVAWRGYTYWHDSEDDTYSDRTEIDVVAEVLGHPSCDDDLRFAYQPSPKHTESTEQDLVALLGNPGPLDLDAVERILRRLDAANSDPHRLSPPYLVHSGLAHAILERWLFEGVAPSSLDWNWREL